MLAKKICFGTISKFSQIKGLTKNTEASLLGLAVVKEIKMTPKEFLAWILKVCDADAKKSDKRFYDTRPEFRGSNWN